MLSKIKNDYDKIMKDDNIDSFVYVIDKKNNTMSCIKDTQTVTKLTQQTQPDISYQLDLVTQREDKYNNKINQLNQTIETDKVVLACTQTLLEKATFTESITKLLGILCDFYGGEFACLFERDYDTMMTNVNYKYHKTDVNLINSKYTKSFKISPDDEWTKYLREHYYVFLQNSNDIDKALENSSYYQRFTQSSRENLLVVSLNDNDVILGGIEIDNITKNTEHIELIKTVSAFIVNYMHIKNANLEQQKNLEDLEHQNMLNSTMFECVKTLVDDDDINVSLNELLEIVTNFYGADCTNIYYANASKSANVLTNQHSFALSDEVKSRSRKDLPLDTVIELFDNFDIGGVGYISSVREMKDILENSFPLAYDMLIEQKINSLVFVPFVSHGKIKGFMGVENPKRNLNEVLIVKTMSTFVINYINKNELLFKLEKLSYTDNLTELYNRNFYNNYVDEFGNHGFDSVGVIFADVNGLKKANDNFGHELGDKLIRWSALFFKNNVNGLNFRIGGDEFVCIIEDATQEDFDSIVAGLKDKITSYGEVHISIGSAWSQDTKNIEKVISDADEDMYDAKKRYYEVLAQDERSVKTVLQQFKSSIQNLEIN